MKILRFLILLISFGFLGNKAQAQSGVSVSPPRTYFSLNPGEEDQGKGIGKTIVRAIVGNIPNCNCILYASPGKEAFYEKEGFRKMKTGMALFVDAEKMKDKGFTE